MATPCDKYTYSVIERAIIELIKVYGFSHLEDAALNEITLVTYRLMTLISKDVKKRIDHVRKPYAELTDLIYAAKKRSITTDEMLQLMIWTDPTPLPIKVPKYPVKRREPPVRPFSPAELAEREEKGIPSFCPSIRIKPPPSKVSQKEVEEKTVKSDDDLPPMTAVKRTIQPLTRATVETVRLATVMYSELTHVQTQKAEKPPIDNSTFVDSLYDYHARLQENPVEDRVKEENEDGVATGIIYPPQLCAQPPIFHRRPQLMHTNAPSKVEVTGDPDRDAQLIQEHKNERVILDEMEITRDYPRCVHPTHQHTRPPHSYPKDVFENCPSTPPTDRERRAKAEGFPTGSSSRKYSKSTTGKTPKSQVLKCPPKPRGRPRKHPLPPVVSEPPLPPRKPITIKLAQNYNFPPPPQDEATFALGLSIKPAPNVDLMEGSSRMFIPQHPEASGSLRTQCSEFDVDPQEGTSSMLYRQFEERRAPSRTQQVDDSEQSGRVSDKKEKEKKKEKRRTDEGIIAADTVVSEERHKHKKEKKEKKEKKDKKHKHNREETAEERAERRRLKKERKRQEKADRKRQRTSSFGSEAPVAKKQKEKEVLPRPSFKLLIHLGKSTVAASERVASSSQMPTSSQSVSSWQPTATPVPSSRPIPLPLRPALPPPLSQPVPVNHGVFAEAMKPRPAPAKVSSKPKVCALPKPPSVPKFKKEKDSYSSHRTHFRHTSEKIISERVQMSKALKESLNSIEKKEKEEPEVPVIKKRKSYKKKEQSSSSKTLLALPKPEVVVTDSHSNGEWPCPVCSVPYTELGESMVGCDTCANWYHYSCVGLTHETVPRDDDPWFCAKCKV